MLFRSVSQSRYIGALRIEWVPGEAEVEDLVAALSTRHITRVDVALDYGTDLAQYEWMHTRRKSNKHYSSDGRLETVYLGRRSSAKMVRVYNKTVEQGLDDGVDRWRVECQHRPGVDSDPLPDNLFGGVQALPRVISSTVPVRDAEKLALAQVSPEHYYRLDSKTRKRLESEYGNLGLAVSPEVLYSEKRSRLREEMLEAAGL